MSAAAASSGRGQLVDGEFVFTGEDFRRIAALLYADAGISLADSKATLVYSRLAKRLRTLGLASFRDYCTLIGEQDGLDERQKMLRRLNTETIELYQIHRPDLLAHPEEVAGAFDRLRQAGKIAAAGVSNHTPQQTEALMRFMAYPLASIQPELSALAASSVEDGTLDLAMRAQLAVLAWSPLGGGRLAGDAADPRSRAVAAALDAVAQEQGVSRTAAAYAWVMAHPAAPIPIVGSQTAERIAQAAEAYSVRWTRADWYRVYTAWRGSPLP